MDTSIAHNQFTQIVVTADKAQEAISDMQTRGWKVDRQAESGKASRRITFVRKYQ